MAISKISIEGFWDYAVFDDDGLSGIRNSAPEEAKAAYESFIKEQEDLLEQGIR